MTGDSGFSALVTQFNTEERGGETGDFYYDLTLTEYRDYTPRTIQVQQAANTAPAASVEPARDIPAGSLWWAACARQTGRIITLLMGTNPTGTGKGGAW